MSKAYLVKISDYSQAFADSGLTVVVELQDQALQRLAKYYGYHIERAKHVARDTVNQRWQKIRPGRLRLQCAMSPLKTSLAI